VSKSTSDVRNPQPQPELAAVAAYGRRVDELLLALDGVVQRLRYLAADPNLPAPRLRREVLWVAYSAEAAAVGAGADDGSAAVPDDEMVDLNGPAPF
jgi:hypothetical protein